MSTAQPGSLDDWRARIDALNAQLVDLLNERARCAEQIVEFKKKAGLPVFDSRREKAVLDGVSAHNHGPLSDEAMHRIFNCIMEEHRRLQEERKDIYPKDGLA
jgi:chorismate mutase/prephenate dehydratase